MPNDQQFKARIENVQGGLRILLTGPIVDDAAFPDLKGDESKDIILDLDGVEYINSVGIRRWIAWILGIEKANPDVMIGIENCRPSVARQIQFLHSFLQKGITVDSIYIPYFCDACDNDQEILVKPAELIKAGKLDFSSFETREVVCTQCGARMELDADPTSYTFLVSKK